jgi:Transposase DDE domain
VVDGEPREEIQYYHRICAVSVVSSAFPIPLGMRFQKNGEDEVSCSLALLRELDEQLGEKFLDVLVADALYLQTPFVKAIEELGWDWVINVKENQPELLAESERVISTLAAEKVNDPPELQLWHAPEIYWPIADRSVRVVKTVRQQLVKRVRVERDQGGQERAVKETVVQQGTNFYASNVELGSVPPLFIHQLGRSRWIIDTTVFQTLTSEAHLKRPSVHQGSAKAWVVLTMIRVLAYTLTVVFLHRPVRSHFRKCSLGFCGLAEKLRDWFLVPQADTG